jgi:hypothetical protein
MMLKSSSRRLLRLVIVSAMLTGLSFAARGQPDRHSQSAPTNSSPITAPYTLPDGVTLPPPGSRADDSESREDKFLDSIERRADQIDRSICRGC